MYVLLWQKKKYHRYNDCSKSKEIVPQNQKFLVGLEFHQSPNVIERLIPNQQEKETDEKLSKRFYQDQTKQSIIFRVTWHWCSQWMYAKRQVFLSQKPLSPNQSFGSWFFFTLSANKGPFVCIYFPFSVEGSLEMENIYFILEYFTFSFKTFQW